MIPCRHAVFIEPDSVFRRLIESAKKQVESACPGQPYGSHPPHATLFSADLHPYDPNILHEAATEFGPMEIEVRGMVVFFDDPLTGGGHTVAFRVVGPPVLWDLQCAVATHMSPFLHLSTPSVKYTDPRMRESRQRYGFPFVGAHWIPHFTIASLLTPRGHPLLKTLAGMKINRRMTVSAISLWHVEGDRHERIMDIPLLGKGSS